MEVRKEPCRNRQGWVLLKFMILIGLLVALISYSLSFQLLLNHEMVIDKICRTEQQKIMSLAKENIETILNFNSLAESLYAFQESLKPFIWIPKIAIIYKNLLSLRKNLEKIQLSFITIQNLVLKKNAFLLYSNLKWGLQKLKESYRFQSELHSQALPFLNFKMAIKKKKEIIFPPYELVKDFTSEQKLKFAIISLSKKKLGSILFTDYKQNKYCWASLTAAPEKKLEILYFKKSMFTNTW